MTLPRVAVLMSTFDGARFLPEQLASLAAQADVDATLFVRDDGSSDETLAILAAHSDRWPGLAAPLAGPNLGPALSFMDLLARTPGDFDLYAFCDQDDVWEPGKLARAAEHLQRCDPDRPALYCARVTCVDETLRPLGEPAGDGDGRFEHLLFQNIAYGVTVVMNRPARELIVAHPPRGGLVMHDWWCALATAAFGEVVHDPQSSVLYRQHRSNVIGARVGPLAETLRKLRLLVRAPTRFYPIHAQAAEFLRLFGGALLPDRRGLVAGLVASKASLSARIAYAFTGPVVRTRFFGALTARLLILLGWY